MDPLLSRSAGLVVIGKLTRVDDTGDQQMVQFHRNIGAPDGVEELVDNLPRVTEYGFFSCPPEGSEAVALFLGGRRSNGVVIATGLMAQRIKNLEAGEVMLANLLTGAHVLWAQDGTIKSQSSDWQHTGDLHVSGTVYAAHVIPADSASGSFTTVDGKTVTVTHGIITAIV